MTVTPNQNRAAAFKAVSATESRSNRLGTTAVLILVSPHQIARMYIFILVFSAAIVDQAGNALWLFVRVRWLIAPCSRWWAGRNRSNRACVAGIVRVLPASVARSAFPCDAGNCSGRGHASEIRRTESGREPAVRQPARTLLAASRTTPAQASSTNASLFRRR